MAVLHDGQGRLLDADRQRRDTAFGVVVQCAGLQKPPGTAAQPDAGTSFSDARLFTRSAGSGWHAGLALILEHRVFHPNLLSQTGDGGGPAGAGWHVLHDQRHLQKAAAGREY